MAPPTFQERRRVERAARTAALRERLRLGTIDDYRFEIFEEIHRMGIWLMFQPLTRLYGFYQRTEDAAGIVVHMGHPTSLQRYTAAHEYAHHALGHLRSLDGRAEIEGGPTVSENPLQEIEAQAFAGALLMPLHLVQRALAALAIDITNPSPASVYDLSLRFGVSYQAMCTQLWAYGLIDPDVLRGLDMPPLRIKEQLGGGQPPVDHRADLWVVGEDTMPEVLPLQIADEVVIRVRESSSTGYRWRLDASRDSPVRLVNNSLGESAQDDRLGGFRTRSIRLRAHEPGRARLRLRLSRAFEPDRPIQSLETEVAVADPATGTVSHGLFADQQRQLAARRT